MSIVQKMNKNMQYPYFLPFRLIEVKILSVIEKIINFSLILQGFF